MAQILSLANVFPVFFWSKNFFNNSRFSFECVSFSFSLLHQTALLRFVLDWIFNWYYSAFFCLSGFLIRFLFTMFKFSFVKVSARLNTVRSFERLPEIHSTWQRKNDRDYRLNFNEIERICFNEFPNGYLRNKYKEVKNTLCKDACQFTRRVCCIDWCRCCMVYDNL